MKSKRYILLVFAVLFVAGVSYAQPDKPDKVQALKVSFITDKLNLSPQEAQGFWPLYNEYTDKIRLGRKIFRKQYGPVKEFKSDKEAEDYLSAELKLKQNEVDLQKEYYEKFKKVLGARKTALLHKAEEEFKKVVLESMGVKNSGSD
jgi:hypothetical protein